MKLHRLLPLLLLVVVYVSDRQFVQSLQIKKKKKKKSETERLKITGRDRMGVVVSVDNVLINKKHKFLFCPIQKSGSSLWDQLFLRLEGDPHWWEPPWHKKLPAAKNFKLNSREFEEIMYDNTWTKAVFFRDPSRRLLSAWKYCIHRKEQVNHYRSYMTKLTNSTNYTWPAFLESVTSPLKHQNLHWRPQTDFCGLHKFFPLYNFVGNLELSWLHGPQLLRRLGIWEEFGAREWSLAKVIKSPISAKKKPGRYKLKHMPENYNKTDCMFCGNFSPHKSKYEDRRLRSNVIDYEDDFLNKPERPPSRENRTESYLTQDAWSKIRYSDYYRQDYDVFSNIKSGPFVENFYSNYPPPQNAMG